MSKLIRSNSPVAEWTWVFFNRNKISPLLFGAPIALSVADVLNRTGLLVPESLEVEWFAVDGPSLNIMTEVRYPVRDTENEFVDEIWRIRPVKYPDARPGILYWRGPGYWLAPSGNAIKEISLLTVSITLVSMDAILSVGVHHDIWAENDFYGSPHHEVSQRNAPRLAEALRNLGQALGEAPAPEDPTDFAAAVEEGVESLVDHSGAGIDVSENL